jgi:hypothetical protein
MYLTARQLQQIIRDTGAARLPFGARLTPSAQDLLRSSKLQIQYVDPRDLVPKPASAAPARSDPSFYWWCGTQSGTAKAAIAMVARETSFNPLVVLDDGSSVLNAVRALANGVSSGVCAGGVLAVEHAGVATIVANKSPVLRATVATSLASIDAAVRDVAANVLVIEPASQSLMQLKNAILRFVRAQRPADSELLRELAGGVK